MGKMDSKDEMSNVVPSLEITTASQSSENVDDEGNQINEDSPRTVISLGQSTDFLITPTLHINNVYRHNYPSEVDGESSSMNTTIDNKPPKYLSPAASSGPICRICHDGDGKEDLLSPCRCSGTLGLVHRSCMEKWLSTRVNDVDKCEICNYNFVTIRTPKSFCEFIRCEANNSANRRSFMGDLTCFFLLTPLAFFTSYLCIDGAQKQVGYNNSIEAGSLMALATFLSTIYVVWNILTIRFHVRNYLTWRVKNTTVKLVKVQRVSATFDEAPNHSCVQVIPEENDGNHSPNVVINIPNVP